MGGSGQKREAGEHDVGWLSAVRRKLAFLFMESRVCGTRTRKEPLEEWVWQLCGLEVSGVSTGILPKHNNI